MRWRCAALAPDRSVWARYRAGRHLGFDFGNSPFEVSKVDFQVKTIIQRTSAGTHGIVVAAHRAERLYASSLVTADPTVRAMLAALPD
jgi:2-phosphosulfolactate phosphatase